MSNSVLKQALNRRKILIEQENTTTTTSHDINTYTSLPIKTILLIDGYIQEIQQSLPKQVIPYSINQLCHTFHYKHYIGLTNQGATDYLNALIQCLYHTPEIKYSLFSWHYNPPLNTTFYFQFNKQFYNADNKPDPPPHRSIPFQLQCLFARLQKSTKVSCTTADLTKSFGWNDAQLFQQHDVQELMTVLFDAISKVMKERGNADILNRFCKVILSDYLQCQSCLQIRSRDDICLDLSVTIKNVDNLDDALKQSILYHEMLDGDNIVFCEYCNKKQNFKKGLKIKKLSKLLFINLNRFSFDLNTMRRVKLRHKVVFPLELDMRLYIEDEILKEMENVDELIYCLYAVILHSGNIGGHNYAFIKPFDHNEWFEFNDSLVVNLNDSKKNFDDVYGGENVVGSAYILLYRQKNLKFPENYRYLPEYLISMLKKENKSHEKSFY